MHGPVLSSGAVNVQPLSPDSLSFREETVTGEIYFEA